MDGIAGVQSRINEIVGRFSAGSVAGGVLGAGAASDADDFASTLARAEESQATSASSATSTDTYVAPTGGDLNKAGVDPVQWAKDFLTALGMPTSSENVRAVTAWEQAEGTRAHFNPLATTQGGFAGTSNLNSVGVKNYASYQDGIAANVKAITNGRYENVLAALRQGTSATAVAQAIAEGPWGTHDGVLRVLRGAQGATV
ncbi:MAG TPA: hypothetical protein VFX21_04525 [Acidimicrobiia bacterium]|nr:hypothetical protein [Acidimicrobiia bacterium]